MATLSSDPTSELPSDLPSGTVTFLFTDIEGSTRLWERYQAAMARAVDHHDRSLRAAIEAHGGYIFKTMGDAFCAAFRTATDAVVAAVEGQTLLLASDESDPPSGAPPLKVRMAIHTGAAELRDGDYFGAALSRADRLVHVIHGGQVVLSQAARDLAADSLPEQVTLLDLGVHALRDLQRPEHAYQVVHPALPSGFAPLRSLSYLPNNLPRQLTRFIGREEQVEQVKRVLTDARLVTLTGSGGCGKTRLALQAAADLLEVYPDGVWLVELAALTDAALVPQAVATSLGVTEAAGQTLEAAMIDHLRSRRLLIVLDNCEHLIERCARLAEELLRATESLSILATAREPLGVPGEIAWRVPSLSIPKPLSKEPAPAEVEALARTEAAQLFVDRARHLQPGFQLDPRSAPAVSEICRRLDGIPLAIELAAALVNVLSPEQICARLTNFFRILTRGSRTALDRHRTLQAAIDWSYGLLEDREKSLLRRVAVFQGGWDLEAAEAVCSGPDLDEMEVLEALSRLVDKSLVTCETPESGSIRYRLLESVRQYGQELLEKHGEQAEIAERHRAHFNGLAREGEKHLQSEGQQKWLERLEREHDNIRAALKWSAMGESRLRMAVALHRFWLLRGHLTEGRGWLEGALASRDKMSVWLLACALDAAGVIACYMGDYEAARQHYAECLALWREVGNLNGEAATLNNLGMVAWSEGKLDVAREEYSASLDIYRKIGPESNVAISLSNAGAIAILAGAVDEAVPLLQEALEIQRRMGDAASMANTIQNLGEAMYRLGDYASAKSSFHECLMLHQKVGVRSGIVFALLEMAKLEVKSGNYARAARLLGGLDRLRGEIQLRLPMGLQETYDATVQEVRLELGETEYAAELRRAAQMNEADIIRFATK